TLNDDSEEVISILLSGLPDGFLVYTGADHESAVLARNAGGAGGTNTWVISDAHGSLPAYVAILPPQYWSGELAGLKLTVESGERTVSERKTDEQAIEPTTIHAVANGIKRTPTATFDAENSIISMNLNASMSDVGSNAADDSSTETTTLQITGLGEYASF